MANCEACGSTEGFEEKYGEIHCRNCGRTEKGAAEYLKFQKQQRREKFIKHLFIFFVVTVVVSAFSFLFMEHPTRFDRLVRELGGMALLVGVISGVAFGIDMWRSRRK